MQDTKRKSMCEMIKVERGSVRQRKPPILMLASHAKEMENETSDHDPRVWYRFIYLLADNDCVCGVLCDP